MRIKDPITIMFGILLLVLTIGFATAEHALPGDLVDSDTGLIEGMGQWANDVTDGIFWVGMLLCFCVVLMIATFDYGVPKAFGFAGTTGMFGAITLGIIGWIPWWIASIFIVAGAGSIAFMVKSK